MARRFADRTADGAPGDQVDRALQDQVATISALRDELAASCPYWPLWTLASTSS